MGSASSLDLWQFWVSRFKVTSASDTLMTLPTSGLPTADTRVYLYFVSYWIYFASLPVSDYRALPRRPQQLIC